MPVPFGESCPVSPEQRSSQNPKDVRENLVPENGDGVGLQTADRG